MLTARMAARVTRDAGSWMSVVKMNVSSVTTITSSASTSTHGRAPVSRNTRRCAAVTNAKIDQRDRTADGGDRR